MKSFLAIMTLALLALVPSAFADDHMAKKMHDMKPVQVVVFYSDTCGSCKVLEPRMMDAMKAINPAAIEVVKFDFSNKDAIAATKTLAGEKGVNDVLQKYGAKTGFAVVLDGNGNEVVKLTVNHETSDIAQEFAKSIVHNNKV